LLDSHLAVSIKILNVLIFDPGKPLLEIYSAAIFTEAHMWE
jgi:hypothetical protein